MEEIHERHFYEEEQNEVNCSLGYDKGNLQLQLNADILQNGRPGHARKNSIQTGMCSPDFGILKMASPDLEKMLIAFQTGNNASTKCCPSNMTNEQTSASTATKGLPEVLQELHDRQDNNEYKGMLQQINTGETIVTEETINSSDQLYLTTDVNGLMAVADNREKFKTAQTFSTTFSTNDNQLKHAPNRTYVFPNCATLLPNTQFYTTPLHNNVEDYEAVNQFHALTAYNNVLAASTPFATQMYKLDGSAAFEESNTSIQPINLDMQEMVKRERKKQRNRVASSKCRKKKLEKEAVLESTVKELRARNVELTTLANALKQQICELKQRVMDHVTEGCPITLTSVEEQDDLYNEEEWRTFSEKT